MPLPTATETPTTETAAHESNGHASEANTAAPGKAKRKAAKKAGKSTSPKASTKKAGKKKAAKSNPNKNASTAEGTHRDADVPMNGKKAAILRAMKALHATSKSGARSSKDIAEKATTNDLEIKERDVRHYGYHAKAGGLCDVAEVEGVRGWGFYLTAKGQNLDIAAELKARQKKAE